MKNSMGAPKNSGSVGFPQLLSHRGNSLTPISFLHYGSALDSVVKNGFSGPIKVHPEGMEQARHGDAQGPPKSHL